MRSFRKLAIATCFLGVGIQDSLASEVSYDSREEVLRWLDGKNGFYFSDKLSQKDGRIIVNGNVEADEVLMEIPMSAILTTEDDEGNRMSLCKLYNTLVRELDLKEASKYAPYLRQIQQEQETDIGLPSLWSSTGKRLLKYVSMTYPANKISSVLEDYSHCIDGERKEEEFKTEEVPTRFGIYNGKQKKHHAVEETQDEKAQKYSLALVVKHQVDQKYMIPLYDQLEHHHYSFNVNHLVLEDSSVRIVAVRDIAIGERLSRPSMGCLEDCDGKGQANFIETFKNYGEVQPYPHVWDFGVGISVVYHGSHEGETPPRPAELGKVEWIVPPEDESQIAMLAEEYRLQVTEYLEEVVPSRESVDEREWRQINKYCHSLIDALENIVLDGLELELMSEEDEEDGSHDSEDSEDEDSEDEDSEDEVNEDNDDGDENHFKMETREKMKQVASRIAAREAGDHVDTEIEAKAKEVASLVDSEQLSAKKASNSTDGYPWTVKGCDLSKGCELDDIADSRECGEVYDYDAYRNETDWAIMRIAYMAVVGPQQASVSLTYGSGFKVPIKVAHSPGRGRGVFATEDIPKGTLVWRSEYSAIFTDGQQFRKFLSVLQDDMVCDLIIWCYTTVGEGKKNIIECDLDEGSLVNSYDDISEYNIGNDDSSYDSTGPDSIYAVRDIKAGEELITAYDEFDTEKYEEFGL